MRLHSTRSSTTSPWPSTWCANAWARAKRCSTTGRAALTKMKGTPDDGERGGHGAVGGRAVGGRPDAGDDDLRTVAVLEQWHEVGEGAVVGVDVELAAPEAGDAVVEDVSGRRARAAATTRCAGRAPACPRPSARCSSAAPARALRPGHAARTSRASTPATSSGRPARRGRPRPRIRCAGATASAGASCGDPRIWRHPAKPWGGSKAPSIRSRGHARASRSERVVVRARDASAGTSRDADPSALPGDRRRAERASRLKAA